MNKLSRLILIIMFPIFLTSCGLEVDGESLIGDDFEIGTLGCNAFVSGDEGMLEVPPDLKPVDTSNSLIVPTGNRINISESAMNSYILPARLDMQIYREGDVSWLAVDTNPASLWPVLIEFLEKSGFQIMDNDPKQGYIVTQWRNRRIPMSQQLEDSILLRTRLYARIEREPNAVTNIFFVAQSAQKSSDGWGLVPTEPSFEYSVLSRFKTHLSSGREVANSRMPSIEDIKIPLDIVNVSGTPVLYVGQHYSKVWRRMAATLMRNGMNIRRDDRSRGLYLVEYSPGSSLDDTNKSKKLIKLHLLPQGSSKTLVTIHPAKKVSNPLSYKESQEVLKHIVMAYSPRAKLAKQ